MSISYKLNIQDNIQLQDYEINLMNEVPRVEENMVLELANSSSELEQLNSPIIQQTTIFSDEVE